MNRTAIAAVLVAALSLVSALPASAGPHFNRGSQDPERPVVVADYTVFVDPPTGFVFIRLPVGWKFVGSVTQEDVARLPGTVVTTLLPPDEQRMATSTKPAQAAGAKQGR
ncbi:MAG TPA: hypothetical protein VFU71_08465 [Burkholderiaceae bacterium]|nr:hypothetical protein [Burkholderiaceae bacterium]